MSPSRSRSRGRHRARTDDDRARPHAFQGYQEPRRVFVGGVPKVTTEERFGGLRAGGTIDRVELNAERSPQVLSRTRTRPWSTRSSRQDAHAPSSESIEHRRPSSRCGGRKPRGNRRLCQRPLKLRSTAPRNGPSSTARAASKSPTPTLGQVAARHQRRAQRSSPALHARPYFKNAQLRRVPQYKVAVAVQTLKRARDDALVALAVRVAPQREAQAAS